MRILEFVEVTVSNRTRSSYKEIQYFPYLHYVLFIDAKRYIPTSDKNMYVFCSAKLSRKKNHQSAFQRNMENILYKVL